LHEDLYYRLAAYEIALPPLRDRGDDILLLARAFLDELNAEHGTHHTLDPECEQTLRRHAWPGNVRELRSAICRAHLTADDQGAALWPLRTDAGSVGDPCPGGNAGQVVFRVGMSYAEVETAMLMKTLAHYGGDKRAAAAALGVSTRTVHNQLARLKQRESASTARTLRTR
jgi:DNA-binding NtrC family response regulator